MPETVVVGGGHTGLVASWHLAARGVDHVVLAAGLIGETWRTQRWESFACNTPTWMTRPPGDGDDPEPQDGFLLRDQWVSRLGQAAPRELAAEGFGAIIWATGFGPDVAFLDAALRGTDGAPLQENGVGVVPGLWCLGIPWQRTRASAVVFGADADAAVMADAVVAHLG